MSYAQCPICALRFRYQSELETHAHDDHCLPAQVQLPKPAERPQTEQEPVSRLLRLP